MANEPPHHLTGMVEFLSRHDDFLARTLRAYTFAQLSALLRCHIDTVPVLLCCVAYDPEKHTPERYCRRLAEAYRLDAHALAALLGLELNDTVQGE